jgi:hypothetical protein
MRFGRRLWAMFFIPEDPDQQLVDDALQFGGTFRIQAHRRCR